MYSQAQFGEVRIKRRPLDIGWQIGDIYYELISSCKHPLGPGIMIDQNQNSLPPNGDISELNLQERDYYIEISISFSVIAGIIQTPERILHQ